MRLRTGNRRRAKAHARAEAERIRQWRLKKLRRLVIRELAKGMLKHFEDLILHGSGFASGGIVNVPRGGFPRASEPCFFGIDLARPGSDRSVSGLYLDGKLIGEVKEISLVDYPAWPWGGGPEFVIMKDKPIRIPGLATIKDSGA